MTVGIFILPDNFSAVLSKRLKVGWFSCLPDRNATYLSTPWQNMLFSYVYAWEICYNGKLNIARKFSFLFEVSVLKNVLKSIVLKWLKLHFSKRQAVTSSWRSQFVSLFSIFICPVMFDPPIGKHSNKDIMATIFSMRKDWILKTPYEWVIPKI